MVSFYAEAAVIDCGCGAGATVAGRQALEDYWLQRFAKHPASAFVDLQPASDGAAVTYLCAGSEVRADFAFDATGKNISQRCGPRSDR